MRRDKKGLYMPHHRNLSALVLTLALAGFGLAGCGGGGAPVSAGSTAVSSPPTSASPAKAQHGENGAPIGWTYLNVGARTGGPSVIVKLLASGGTLDLIVSHPVTTSAGAEIFRPLLMRYNLASGDLSGPSTSPYAFPHTLATATPTSSVALYYPTFDKPPVFVRAGSQSEIAPFPSAVPTYYSGINPATNPGPLDNVVIGTTGQWVWVALKGPAAAPFSGLVWQFRHWNRILAVNLQTRQFFVYPIPPSSSLASVNPGWWEAPGFASAGQRVYIAVGSWLGVFPSVPTSRAPVVLTGPPAALTAARGRQMMAALSALYWQASDGLASYWNCSVMQDPSLTACPAPTSGSLNGSWVLDPTVFNHGDYPAAFLWAASFPLVPGSAMANTRAQMVATILRLVQSPLTTAQILYPTAAAARAGFHDTPPTPLPGFTIKGSYYWAVPAGS